LAQAYAPLLNVIAFWNSTPLPLLGN